MDVSCFEHTKLSDPQEFMDIFALKSKQTTRSVLYVLLSRVFTVYIFLFILLIRFRFHQCSNMHFVLVVCHDNVMEI